MTEQKPTAHASPCVRNCCLDQNDVCLGCGRHIEEIVGWGNANATTQAEILERARLRKANRQQQLPPWPTTDQPRRRRE